MIQMLAVLVLLASDASVTPSGYSAQGFFLDDRDKRLEFLETWQSGSGFELTVSEHGKVIAVVRADLTTCSCADNEGKVSLACEASWVLANSPIRRSLTPVSDRWGFDYPASVESNRLEISRTTRDRSHTRLRVRAFKHNHPTTRFSAEIQWSYEPEKPRALSASASADQVQVGDSVFHRLSTSSYILPLVHCHTEDQRVLGFRATAEPPHYRVDDVIECTHAFAAGLRGADLIDFKTGAEKPDACGVEPVSVWVMRSEEPAQLVIAPDIRPGHFRTPPVLGLNKTE
jgi:hypothetical protein